MYYIYLINQFKRWVMIYLEKIHYDDLMKYQSNYDGLKRLKKGSKVKAVVTFVMNGARFHGVVYCSLHLVEVVKCDKYGEECVKIGFGRLILDRTDVMFCNTRGGVFVGEFRGRVCKIFIVKV